MHLELSKCYKCCKISPGPIKRSTKSIWNLSFTVTYLIDHASKATKLNNSKWSWLVTIMAECNTKILKVICSSFGCKGNFYITFPAEFFFASERLPLQISNAIRVLNGKLLQPKHCPKLQYFTRRIFRSLSPLPHQTNITDSLSLILI